MKRMIITVLMLLIMFLFIGSAFGQDLVVYPAKGQSKDQMEKDKFDCYNWAKQETGFDPTAGSTTTAAAPQSESSAVRGAARGALVGVAAGAIAGDAGKGAAIGAASGGLLGGMKGRDQRRQQESAQQQQAAAQNKKRSDYNRAYGACLEGKGYTVK
jgi:hypothetical protein